MSSLKNQLASSRKTEGPRINPEIDAKLNTFIAQNQEVYDHYLKQDKSLLARKLMLQRMRRAESQAVKVDALVEVVSQNPELKTRYDAAMARVPADKRVRAARNIAQNVLAEAAVAAQKTGVKIGV